MGGVAEDDGATIIPLNDTAEDDMSVGDLPQEMPILPLRNAVLFPSTVLPVGINRKASQKLVKDMDKHGAFFVVSTQTDNEVENPQVTDLCKVGTVARIVKVLQMPDNSVTAILQGVSRVTIEEQIADAPYITARVSLRRSENVARTQKSEFAALSSTLKDTAVRIIKSAGTLPPEAAFAITNIEPGSFLINFIASNIEFKVEHKLEILAEDNVQKRGLLLLKYLNQEEQFINLKNDIQSKVRKGIDQQQREYMLQQQIRTIQDELGGNPTEQQLKDYKERAKEKKWSEDVKNVFDKEIEKLDRLNPNSGEYSVQCNYVENMLSLPWQKKSKDNFDLKKAERCLNRDHYGLDKVKERILEHLAVLKLTGSMKSPILCLYGPPGVGKTSLGNSIAESLGRKYVRMSLGGLHDESEIRGHRRTYVGAMMGRILQNIAKAGTSNPVFVLDEIDKISTDFHGDPASALLEVLDPEQNATFHDNYLDIDYDLSNVMFIATANTISTISGPLLDRMELIDVSGYLQEEKVEIAQRHLLPKQMKNHGLDKSVFALNKKGLNLIIEKYTRESGVRELDKTLARLCRKVALAVAKADEVKRNFGPDEVRQFLGVERFNHDIWQDNLTPGVVTGLAWTAVGGEILFVEANTSSGKGNLTLTGNLGDVMKESAILALEYVRSNAALWGLSDVPFDETHVHIHVPEGAVPKDGPSAGITMVTAIVSAFTKRKVKKRIAMTGEITLRGRVLPVGGIKEKILAAKRAGITDIVLSKENLKDISEIKAMYVEGVNFHYVSEIPEVLNIALEE